ncbi:serine dehydratase subunit alpha family protein [bacterium D16-76]|nr:serine dehydratase subunit alpha family protein [bacterium D16-76]
MLTREKELAYRAILKEELVPATGCTEPIALAYGAARLRDILGARPEGMRAELSGNIIKNVKSVVVPNTGGLKGIRAAMAAGVVAGDAGRVLQVIASVRPQQQGEIAEYAQDTPIEVACADTPRMLDICFTGWAGGHKALVHIANSHSNIVREERDGEVLLEKPVTDSAEDSLTDKSVLNVADILEFANTAELGEMAPLLDKQIDCNTAIAEEGLKNSWGANIGSVLLADYPEGIKTEAKAWAAAGSDARMSGCEMPVVILSGSGNQGITASVPVVRYAKHLGVDREKLHRALLVSDLVTIHQKSGIGRLSAYCGAVSAGVGAGAGIAYLLDGSYRCIAHTIVNAVAIISGTICDGAKPSCAAKIAASVDAGLLGYSMYKNHQEFKGGDGIVTKGVDNTIANVGILAQQGMRQTDQTILAIMEGRCN